MEVIVPDEFLSVAIGKRGQNVRLASKLTGWHLDVNSESRYSEAMKSGYDSLVELPGVGISMADALYEEGFYSAEEVSKASIDHLIQIRGVGEEKAKKLIEGARLFVETQQSDDEAEDTAEAEQTQADVDEGTDNPEDQKSEFENAEVEEAQTDEITEEPAEADTQTEEVKESEASDENDADKTA